MTAAYVFISYSRQDRTFVQRLVSSLREEGVQTWTDLENISPGQEWAQEIERGLLRSSALIYVASRNSTQSEWMDVELRAFLSKNSHVIPVIIDDEGVASLPIPLRQFQWADFRGPFQPAFAALLDGIRGLQQASPVAASEAKSKGYVFISYADEDSEFVLELKTFMKKQGYGYWDFRESKRNYQIDFLLELEGIIKDAAGTLSVISPEWKRSPTAFKELQFSWEVGTPVFLLKVKDPGPTLAISGLTYIDFIVGRQNGFEKLNEEMRRKGL